MLSLGSWYWWFSFEVWGPFLLRRKRPQWSLLTASHWMNTVSPNLLFIQWMGSKRGFAFLFVQTSLVNSITTNQIMKAMQRELIQDCVVSSRIDAHTFKSIKGLMVASDCKDMSTFVKQALISQCHKITKDLSDELIQQIKANNQ